ncbi:hypothetical protein AAG570_011150 [Ranatra chinensis]|uniref:Uncharacterized protein n=1 Tax=Ranatra chinensis TaxID=642074 RepID=A0ABD0Z210_9HEMI
MSVNMEDYEDSYFEFVRDPLWSMVDEFTSYLEEKGVMFVIYKFLSLVLDVTTRPKNPSEVLVDIIKSIPPDTTLMEDVKTELDEVKLKEYLLEMERKNLKLLIELMREEGFLEEPYQGLDGNKVEELGEEEGKEEGEEEKGPEEGKKKVRKIKPKKKNITKPKKKIRFKLNNDISSKKTSES